LSRNFVFLNRTTINISFWRYVVAVMAAFLLNQLVLHVAGSLLGNAPSAHLVAQFSGAVTYTIANFFACRYWVFREPACATARS
jgi:hypothetical protein